MSLRAALICTSLATAAADFDAWKAAAGRKFSDDENSKRMSYYIVNMDEASEMSDLNPKAKFGENEMADWSADEFASLLSKDTSAERVTLTLFSDDVLKDVDNKPAIDWRGRAVTEVKSQGKGCASGWAYAAAAAIEGQRSSISGWKLEGISVEDFVRCDHMNKGCSGGTAHEAITWSAENGGVFTEELYPSTNHAEPARCTRRAKGSPPVAIRAVGALPTSEKEMLHFLRNWGPFAVEMCATSLLTYQRGIITNCKCENHDHSAAIVGWGVEDGVKYWLLKNSWGTGWGESGYLRLEYGKNMCGIEDKPTFGMVDLEPAHEQAMRLSGEL
eukprot:TRINITY_DN11948_c0_g1_i1.p1 TRINITY_DN11948_c0_g1~~TRINITY_DN11948_c0_g1_i1.p1  ORF type:complete len:331 (+),score=62.73 TRINITY_DN11948_c0_g1_i1:59-1051(+)